MGVHGLTTYLRANNAAIARTFEFTSKSEDSTRTVFVIDGWSFIYETLALLDLPWVYGGEYSQFSSAVHKIVRAWLNLGLQLHFVFDGPFPELKFPTLVTRATSNSIKPSLLFFRTSAVSRSKPKFLRESFMLPPRAYAACVQTLVDLQASLSNGTHDEVLELHFADEEGDPYAVELAGRLGGYVVGKDSDFVILNAEGYQGYIPLDDIFWTASITDDTTSVSNTINTDDSEWGDNDGFQTVVNSKSKRKVAAKQKTSVETGLGIIPPETSSPESLQLSVTVYSPADLATHLAIPLSLLPLLAALVGNDFTGLSPDEPSGASTSGFTNLQWLFFERQLTLSQRITRVASTLHNILKAAVTVTPSGVKKTKTKNRDKDRVTSVMELIDRAVSALIVRNIDGMASGEKERVVERVVEATLQYAIPRWEGEVGQEGRLWTGEVCALHDVGTCPLVLLRHRSQPSPQEAATPSVSEYDEDLTQARALYLSAYRKGHLDPHTLDVLHTGTFWYRQFLENPDLEAVGRTFARPVQLWMYAILDEVFGIPGRAVEEEDEDEEDEDELIDVVEESDTDTEDPLAPLRGALQQLNQNGSSSSSTLSTTAAQQHLLSSQQNKGNTENKKRPRKIVDEYVRRGTRLAVEEVEVTPLSELLSTIPSILQSLPSQALTVQSPSTRVLVLLRAIDTPSEHLHALSELLLGLPAEQRVPVLVLRAVVQRLDIRARESGSREREKERWTKDEARAFLGSFSYSSSIQGSEVDEREEVEIPIVDRNVQLSAQVLATMDAVERLAECLLLTS
ncbi:hypothetical protein BC629DRAFT_1241319, partial [Irpex lacteus]